MRLAVQGAAQLATHTLSLHPQIGTKATAVIAGPFGIYHMSLHGILLISGHEEAYHGRYKFSPLQPRNRPARRLIDRGIIVANSRPRGWKEIGISGISNCIQYVTHKSVAPDAFDRTT